MILSVIIINNKIIIIKKYHINQAQCRILTVLVDRTTKKNSIIYRKKLYKGGILFKIKKITPNLIKCLWKDNLIHK